MNGQNEDIILTRQKSVHSSRHEVFYFLPNTFFFKTILIYCTIGAFNFAQYTKPNLRQNQKRHFMPMLNSVMKQNIVPILE